MVDCFDLTAYSVHNTVFVAVLEKPSWSPGVAVLEKRCEINEIIIWDKNQQSSSPIVLLEDWSK